MNNYEIGYNMLTSFFDNQDMVVGLNKTIESIKRILKAQDIALFSKNIDDKYDYSLVNTVNEEITKIIKVILNHAKNKIEDKEYLSFSTSIDNQLINFLFIPITTGNIQYILALTDCKIDAKNTELMKIISQSLKIVLAQKELFDKLNIDPLTDLNNRYAYNKKIAELDSQNGKYVIALYDLFRLKYVNDKYGHELGDIYIKKATSILKKYFPEYKYEEKDEKHEKVKTNSYLYRIGGDEFALITTEDSKEVVEIKTKLAREEIASLVLTDEEKLPIGLNYGIAYRNSQEQFRDLSLKADDDLRKDKTLMYKTLGIERRV